MRDDGNARDTSGRWAHQYRERCPLGQVVLTTDIIVVSLRLCAIKTVVAHTN